MKPNPITNWLRDNGRTSAWLADQLGCTRAHLSAIGTGRGKPSPIIAKSLERVTGIPASAWGVE